MRRNEASLYAMRTHKRTRANDAVALAFGLRRIAARAAGRSSEDCACAFPLVADGSPLIGRARDAMPLRIAIAIDAAILPPPRCVAIKRIFMSNMKRSFGGLLFSMLLLAAPVMAAPPGGLPVKPQPPQPFGTWQATVRWLDPHTVPGPNGTTLVYSFHYEHIVATSQSDCEGQLQGYASQLNVMVTEFCAFHPY
jgi:hypothetical protein